MCSQALYNGSVRGVLTSVRGVLTSVGGVPTSVRGVLTSVLGVLTSVGGVLTSVWGVLTCGVRCRRRWIHYEPRVCDSSSDRAWISLL